jgi:serine O-acetyltransferase
VISLKKKLSFIRNQKKNIIQMKNICADFKRKQKVYLEDGVNVTLFRIVMSDGSSAMVLYRSMRWFARKNITIVAYIIQLINKFLNGCVIGVGADFGPGLVIMHSVGIVINSKVNGGENITLEGGVVIGDDKGNSPILRDDIFIGSGAKVIGKITVESFSKIGANAVVTKTVPYGATMLGVPAVPYFNDRL